LFLFREKNENQDESDPSGEDGDIPVAFIRKHREVNMIQQSKTEKMTNAALRPSKIQKTPSSSLFCFPARLVTRLMMVATLFLLSGATWKKAAIEIMSPENGAVVAAHVPVKYAFHHEWRADHVHVFVDGKFIMETHKNPFMLTLDKGPHTIMLRASTSHHNLLKIRASVDVTVK